MAEVIQLFRKRIAEHRIAGVRLGRKKPFACACGAEFARLAEFTEHVVGGEP